MYSSGVIYMLQEFKTKNSASTYMLQQIVDLRDMIKSIDFGPIKPRDANLKIRQGNHTIRLFFASCYEAINFFDFILSNKEVADSVRESVAARREEVDKIAIDGWEQIYTPSGFNEDSMDSMINLGMTRFFYLDTTSGKETMVEQVLRWKQGLKWYNEVSNRMQVEAQLNHVQYFKVNFSNNITAFLVNTWNENMDKFNFDESVVFLSIVGNVFRHTDILTISFINSNKTKLLQTAVCLSLESLFMNNFALPVKSILNGFWSPSNFEFFGNRIVSNSIADILRILSSVKDKLDPLNSDITKEIMRRLCIE